MAARQTSDIFVRLNLENVEGIDKLKSAFRDLDKTLGVSNRTIETARQRINEYVAGTTRSEQVIRGQISALQGLRSQVDLNGRGYAELTAEINQLQTELRGSTDAVERQREALLRSATAGRTNADVLQRQITNLERLRQQTRPGSSAFLQLGQDIDRATASLGRFRTEVSQAASTVTQMPGSTFERIGNQVAILQRRMQTLNFTSAEFLQYQQRINLVNLVQSTIVGRQQVRANAGLYASPQYRGFVEARAETVPLPNTRAGYQQRIGEINAELENITNLERRRTLTLELDQINRRLKGTISDVVSVEQRAVDVVRARVNAQREQLRQSGFGTFSTSLGGRDFKGEQQRETYTQAQQALADLNAAQDAMEAAVRRHQTTLTDIEVGAEQYRQDRLGQLNDAKIAASDAAFKRELAQFDAALQQRDKIERRRNLMGAALGLGPQDRSPFYERVVGLSSAALEARQAFMGRSPSEVYNDIAKSFRMGERTDLLSGVKDAATNVTDTLSEGLVQGSPKAKSAAEKLAEAVKTGIKRAFGIASPSKFIISVVQNLVKTWEDELRSASPRLQLAAERAFGLSGPRRMTSRFVNTIEGKQVVPATNYRALPVRSLDVSSQGPEMDAMMRRYRQQIAALTSQPAIYENLLNALPSSRLTTNLVGLANQRMGMAAQYPDYLPGLRRIEARGGARLQQTPGVDIFDLENEIKRLASSYFREIRVPNPWVGAIGDYKKFIDAIELDTKQLRAQALLSGTRTAGALPPVAESIGGLRQQRIDEAYRRSSERGLRVLAADAFADRGSLALPPANYGFAADPARIARLMARSRRGRLALPPAIDIQATPVVEEATVAAESTSLRTAVKDFFARLRAGVGSAFGGGGGDGGGGRPPTPTGPRPGDLSPDIRKLKTELLDFGPIAERSTASLQELRSVLQGQRELAAPGAAGTAMRREFDQVIAASEAMDKRIERELDRRNRSRRRLSGFQMAQIGGAALSGGIFGGPEGLVGGVIGGAFGGVGGAFAGAAAGAQVGMLRQQLGQTSAYAAEIGKLQIALRGVSGSQTNYNQAISAAAAVTRELNVPQREATAGITRLSAAVLGAGGQMSDATFAFRAISESIKATGGNAEQVDGALLALTQVFSKGKVSAEELNQIAERLPGTFTLFAKATGKSGPELQKALQQGQVGLNDLMKFLELASSKHGQTALKIAASNEEAGARMTVAFQKMALEVGNALKPIGAQIQTAFAKFATDITPQVVDASKGIGGLLKTIVDNGAAVGAVAKLAVQFGIATFALQAFAALKGPVTVALQAIALQFGAVNAQTVAAEARLKAFAVTAKATAASLVAPIVVTLAIVGADIVLKALRDINEAQSNITRVRAEPAAPEWYKRAGGDALTKAQVSKLASTAAEELSTANAILEPLKRQMEVIREARVSGKLGGISSAQFEEQLTRAQRGIGNPADIGFNRIAVQLKAAQVTVDQLTARYQYAIGRYLKAPTTRPGGSGFPDPTGTGDDDKAKRDKATSDAQRTAETLAQQEIRLANAVFQHKQDLERQRYELAKELLDLETKNRLDQMGAVEREAAQALQQRQARETQFAERMRALNERIAKAQQDLASAQRMAAVTGGAPGGRNYSNVGGVQGGRQMLHGIPGYAGYDRAHATPTNIHYHFSGKSPQETLAVANYLKQQGYQITEFGGMGQRVGRHAAGSQHYRNNAFDIGGASLGRTDSQIQAGLKRVHALINGFLTTSTPGPTGAQGRRGIVDTGDVALAQVELQTLRTAYNELIESKGRWDAAADTESVNALTKAFSDQNQELQNTLRTDTLRAELQSKGYTAAQIDLEMKLADALDRRNRTLSEIPLSAPDAIEAVNAKYLTQVDLLTKIYDLKQANANSFGFREGAQRYVESIGTMREATASLTEQGFRGLEDVIFQLTTTGAANFQAFAASILQQTARMIIQQLVLKTIMQAIGAIGGGGGADRSFGTLMAGINKYSANGNVFAANGIVPYAMGGIVNRPTLFPFANGGSIGTGLMGEAGPEAIIPLQRGANGKLGVAGGGGTTNVVVNVDASGGTAVSGDAGQAKQLGQAITAAVQAELVKQKRPGGLLAG